MKRVLITGSEGYIGSILVPMLIERNYSVTGIDTCFFSDGNISQSKLPRFDLIKKDIRDIEKKDFVNQNYFAIIHLAALSNDPLGMLDEKLTFDINYHASVRLAEIAKEVGIERFIYSSSCSLYGQGDGDALTENSPANPQTAYGKSKILAENDIMKLSNENFHPTFMRNATAFGYSPRMRFDLVVNSLVGYAKVENEIKILGDGKPWRPLVHLNDISQSMIKVLESRIDLIHNQIFNIGDNKENYRIKQIAEKVKELYPTCNINIAKKNAGDTRDYNVSFDKLNSILNFRSSFSLDDGIIELKRIFERINLDKDIFEHRYYTRLKQINYLIDNNIIDNTLRRISYE